MGPITGSCKEVPSVVRPAIEKYPGFTKKILELLSKLPADDFIKSVLTTIKDDTVFGKFETEVIEAMELLVEAPVPKQVIDFLFEGVEDGQFYLEDSCAAAIKTLATIIDKKDNTRLIQSIVDCLNDSLENENNQKMMNALLSLTSEL